MNKRKLVSIQFMVQYYIRLLLWCFILLINSNSLHAQKKVDQVIPDAEKRKIIKAKKLYNQFKIYEGERILKDLVKEHLHEAYYHEALVQLQRQVLSQIQPASSDLATYRQSNPDDTTSSKETDDDDPDAKIIETKKEISKKDTVEKEWNGLDTGPRKEDRIKGKKRIDEDTIQTDAIVTIDSSLIKDDSFTDDNGQIVPKKKKINRALEKKIKELSDLAQIPYDSYKNDLIENCRRATLNVEHADSASMYLRELLIDTLNPDIRANDNAKDAYESGLAELYGNDAVGAKIEFEKAISYFADYYSAHLALGDACYVLGKDSTVVKEYNKAHLLQPDRPEPFAKLSMFYYQRGKYKEAAAACIDAISIYPEQQYFGLLKRIVNKTGKDFNTQWLLREVYPLNTSKNYFDITAQEKTPWWQYQAADADVHGYFDTLGIVRPNDKTNERYLEVYAWRRMLADTKRDIFPFARAMDKIGLLECYLFITCFHHDLYGQFHDFAKSHPEKIKDYFYVLINWEDKKFEKLRKEFEPPKEKINEKK